MIKKAFCGLRAAVLSDPLMQLDAYALRHRAYVQEGALKPRMNGVFVDKYDLSRTSVLLGVIEEDAGVVGALRLGIQPPARHGIADFASGPEFVVFPEALAELEADDRPIASGARFAVEPGHPRRSAIAMMLLLSLLICSRASGAKWGIATARGSHLLFYRRLLCMSEVAPARRMPGLEFDYTLLAGDLDRDFEIACAQFPDACREQIERTSPDLSRDARLILPELLLEEAA